MSSSLVDLSSVVMGDGPGTGGGWVGNLIISASYRVPPLTNTADHIIYVRTTTITKDNIGTLRAHFFSFTFLPTLITDTPTHFHFRIVFL